MKQINAYTGTLYESAIQARIGFWLVILVLFLMPLEQVIFPFSLKLVDTALLLLVGYVILIFFRKNWRMQVPLAFPAWIILVASLLAMIAAPLNTGSILAIVQELYIFVWFITLTNILTIFKLSDFDGLIRFWSVIALIEAVTSLMGMMKVGPPMFYTSPIKDNVLDTGSFNRGFGTFANPNGTGAYLAISFFVLQATGWPKWVRVILGIFMYAGIYSTGSMGALLGTAIGFIALVIMNMILNNRRIIFLLVGVLAVSGAAVIVLTTFFNPVQWLSQLTYVGKENPVLALTLGRLTHSVSGRAILVGGAWQVFEQYPLGTGPNTADAHNDYIAFLFDRGSLGLLGWLGIIIITLITPLWKINQYKDKRRRWQMLALWAGFLDVSILAVTHEISHFRQVWALIAFLYAAYYHFFDFENPQIGIPAISGTKKLADEHPSIIPNSTTS